jgi:hypothetical protein
MRVSQLGSSSALLLSANVALSAPDFGTENSDLSTIGAIIETIGGLTRSCRTLFECSMLPIASVKRFAVGLRACLANLDNLFSQTLTPSTRKGAWQLAGYNFSLCRHVLKPCSQNAFKIPVRWGVPNMIHCARVTVEHLDARILSSSHVSFNAHSR